jgi:hypothetical protein
MTLNDDEMAVLLAGARSVPDQLRDDYFKTVADAIRGGGQFKRAVSSARYKFAGGAWSSLSG